MGNHDGGVWAREFAGLDDHSEVDRLLEASGIELLHNRARIVEVRDSQLTLVGTGDLWNQELEAGKAFRGVTGGGAIVWLNHNPDGKDFIAPRHPWHVMLAGHTHGGQVVLPFYGTHFAPVNDKRYVEGLKPWGSRQIHVSRGVGNVGGVRFACRPEVTLLELSGPCPRPRASWTSGASSG
jgi:predicted MPP superfamily phosphohydrolase